MKKVIFTFFISLFLPHAHAYDGLLWEEVFSRIGLKARFSYGFAKHEIKGNGFSLSEGSARGKLNFPLLPAFRPKYRKFSYRKLFVDWELSNVSLNHAQNKKNDLNQIKSTFLNTSEISFTNQFSDWTVTGDIETASIALGLQWGVFYPVNQKIHALKVGVGPILGYLNYKYVLSLCSKYTKNSTIINPTKISSGDCENKTSLETLNHKGLGFGVALNFAILEIEKKKWALDFFDISVGVLAPFSRKSLKVRNLKEKFDVNVIYTNLDFFNFTYYLK